MKKIIIMSRCCFTKLALLSILEEKFSCDIDVVDFVCLSEVNNYSELMILVHVNQFDYETISFLLGQRNSTWFRKAIFITSSEFILFFDYLAQRSLRFIDEKADVSDFKKEISSNYKIPTIIEIRDMLSFNEFQIIKMMISGLTATRIAFRTRKSIKTISAQKISALKKFKLDNRPHSLVKLTPLFPLME